MIDDLDDSFVPLEEAAQRMGLTLDEVLDLVERHALRAYRWGGWGQVMVQPALTNVDPKPSARAPAKKASRRPAAKTGTPRRTG